MEVNKRMHTDNQTLIILFLGVALLVSLYLGTTQFTEFILGIFGGIFMQKTMTEKQDEILTQYYQDKYEKQEKEEDEGVGNDVQ